MRESSDDTYYLPLRRMMLIFAAALLVIVLVGAFMYNAGLRRPGEALAVQTSAAFPGPMSFTPPADSEIPDGPTGASIRRGQQIFLHTGPNAGRYVGNGLSCSNCHLDAGRRPNASPMWAAWVSYPAYREKNGQINTMEDRIRDCFSYSMNAPGSPSGGPPPRADPIYRDLQTYFYWLAKGAPTGVNLPGKGFLKLRRAVFGHDPARGAQVFRESCAACHGADGQGQKNADGSYAFPPLWGPHSFNWGAGMAKIANAAGFIKANMPLGQENSLTDQQTWDVAAYMDSHERPKDPRQAGSIEDARKRFHAVGDYYGQRIGGELLGDGVLTATTKP